MEAKVKHLGLIIALGFFVVQLVLLPWAGLTWDEPSSFFFGRANLKFWLTGNRQYLTDIRNTTLYTDSPFPYIYGEELYPPVSFVVSSAFSYMLAEKYHMLSVIDAHHLGEVFLGSIGIWAFYALAVEMGLTTIVAAVTTLWYGLYPTIFGQMRSDAKDIPLMSMLVVFVYLALRFINSLRKKSFLLHINRAVVTGVALGLACGTKLTAPIILVPMVVWFAASWALAPSFRKAVGPLRKLVPLVLLIGLVGAEVFVFSWPWLWDNLAGNLTHVWQFFRTVGLGMPVQYFGSTYQAGMNLSRMYPFVILLVQTPIELTVLFIIGVAAAVTLFFKKNHPYGLLAVLWFWLGILRFLVPGVIIYAKVRHFIDVMPAFFLLVGFGLSEVRTRMTSTKIFLLLLGIVLAHLVWIDVSLYPYEPSYFNALVGGTKQVAGSNEFDAEYWGSTVAEGMQWIKAQPGRKVVYACGLRHVARFYSDPSITISKTPDTGDFVLVPNAYSWFGSPKNVYSGAGKPVHTVGRMGADLLYIYRITSATWWCGYETYTGALDD